MAVQRLVAITSCPTGIAHTYMAAEALAKAAAEAGLTIKVETQGSIGAENQITDEEAAQADAVIIAADTNVTEDRFAGKPILHASTGDAIRNAAGLIAQAVQLASAAPAPAGGAAQVPAQGDYLARVAAGKAAQKSSQKGPYKHLMNGVSFMIPFVVAGGILIALSFAFGIHAYEKQGTLAAALYQIGAQSAFALFVPILSGYIAYSIADRPGLAPGMIGGLISTQVGAGFLGGIISGFLAGYLALWLVQTIHLPRTLQGLMPVLIVPLLTSLVVGLAMIYVVGEPIKTVSTDLTSWLKGLTGGSAIVLGLILGLMMAFDMGGPVNKAAYTFAVGLLGSGVYQPMAAVMAAGMVPPLGLALATVIAPRKFNAEEKEAGEAAWVLGLSFITEGAIPFAAADPFRVIPSIMAGSAVTAALSMAFGIQLRAPHGGIFVLPIPNVVTDLPLYVLSILVGMVISAVLVSFLKRPVAQTDLPAAMPEPAAA
jgi:PTS system fructose-specific IIC component